MNEAAAPGLVGVREYARLRNCSAPSVVKAIKSQRLVTSVTQGPRGPLIDVAKADEEWARNTDPARMPDEPAKQRGPRRGAGYQRGLELSIACDELLALVLMLEERLSRAWRAQMKSAPSPAGPWKDVYAAWARLPNALEKLGAARRGVLGPLLSLDELMAKGAKSK